jgi:hypothetical protein
VSLRKPTAKETKEVLQKISKRAKVYQVGPFSGLQAFEASSMSPRTFREQLRRNFNLYTNAGEMQALIDHFDIDGNGIIDTMEFLTTFLKLGMARSLFVRLDS